MPDSIPGRRLEDERHTADNEVSAFAVRFSTLTFWLDAFRDFRFHATRGEYQYIGRDMLRYLTKTIMTDDLPPFQSDHNFRVTQVPNPNWQAGDGAAEAAEPGATIEIDPNESGRNGADNYRLLISAIVPRPIALLSTQSADGSSANLAPFSYFNIVSHDPPVFVIGFAGGVSKAKDSLRNLMEMGECTINIISEHMLQAANACSVNAPYGVSEWQYSGLTPVAGAVVRPKRVAESRFAVEGRLMEVKQFESRNSPDQPSNSAMAIIEGVRFWAWQNSHDQDSGKMDIGALKPVSRLGGIMYARVMEGIEIPRPRY